MGAKDLFDFHRQQIPIQHCGRFHHDFCKRQHREFHRESTRIPDAAGNGLSPLAQMTVAGAQTIPRVQNGDDWLAKKLRAIQANLLQSLAMSKRPKIVFTEPTIAS
jgi:hypothetical protein